MENVQETSQGTQISTNDAINAFKNSAALVERPHKLLRLTGKNVAGMLNAILTNDVPKEPRRGVYAMLLNPKGRIQTDLRVLKSGEDILIATEPEGADAAKEILGRYAPFSRAKLEELPDWRMLGLYGPHAKEMLSGPELAEYETAEVRLGDAVVLVAGVARPVSGYDLISTPENLQAVRNHLAQATPADTASYETVRIETGVPRFGADITPDNFPGETGVLEKVVSFQKGCYPGQETVARMHYRGHPNKTLHRFSLEGTAATPGTEVTQNEKIVGSITSVAPLSVNGKTFALGYLSRKADLEAPMTATGAKLSCLEPVRG